MSRMIDADELMRAMYHRAFETDGDTMWQSGCWVRYRAIEQVVKEQPTIEPKKGKWIAKDERPKQEIYICSVCNGWAYSPWIGSRKSPKPNRCRYAYCPNCGSYNGGD